MAARWETLLNDELLYRDLSDRLRWFDEYDKDLIDLEKVKLCEDKAAKRLPLLFDEIRGFTGAVDVPYERYLHYFMFDWEIQSHCSQFSVLPEITKDNKACTPAIAGSGPFPHPERLAQVRSRRARDGDTHDHDRVRRRAGRPGNMETHTTGRKIHPTIKENSI